MSLAAQLQWPNYLASLPTLASLVSGDALNADFEPTFVRATAAQRKLPPPEMDCAAWPWPLEVTTFGGFALKRFGEAMPFEGKVQKKPLELLKSIVSVGRRGVSIHLLCEMLWPESPPEQARTAFKVTLSRLRKLLDVANAFEMTDTRIALNSEVVRVDCARFEMLGDALDTAGAPTTTTTGSMPDKIANASVPSLTALAQQFVAVYRGRFLGNEPCNRWLQSARERWHTRFVRVVISVGTRIEAEHGVDVALPLYERAVEHDALSEELHRRLIAAYVQQGEHAEAISVFRRLRQNLSLTLGVMPSEKTLALVAPLGTATEKHGAAFTPKAATRLS
jgi:DNA-binding SARP family transcriptional activator